jgi:hypothetical protein
MLDEYIEYIIIHSVAGLVAPSSVVYSDTNSFIGSEPQDRPNAQTSSTLDYANRLAGFG